MRQIYDKFSEKKGGLKELYEKGPRNAFFLVKFWVSTDSIVLTIIISVVQVESENYYMCPPANFIFERKSILLLEFTELTPIYYCTRQADLSSDTEEGSNVFYGVSSQYSGTENITISVSTKVCSFGKQVVEKVEVS